MTFFFRRICFFREEFLSLPPESESDLMKKKPTLLFALSFSPVCERNLSLLNLTIRPRPGRNRNLPAVQAIRPVPALPYPSPSGFRLLPAGCQMPSGGVEMPFVCKLFVFLKKLFVNLPYNMFCA
jgi:hypothetical protein